VKRLAIVEGGGTEVVTLDRDGLTLRDGDGVVRDTFGILPLKTADALLLQVYDRGGQLRFSCGATSDLGPSILMNEADGISGTMLAADGIFISLRGEERERTLACSRTGP